MYMLKYLTLLLLLMVMMMICHLEHENCALGTDNLKKQQKQYIKCLKNMHTHTQTNRN